MNTGERWRRVRELFERAFEEKPADVPAWLDRNGVDDWQLREEVLSLIQHHAGAGSFLDNPAGQRLAEFIANDHPLEPGQLLGQYASFATSAAAVRGVSTLRTTSVWAAGWP